MKKNVFRVYIKPFDAFGNYASWIEVTKDVDWDQLGDISQDLDNVDFSIGVYRNNNFNLTLRNDEGLYSDAGGSQSIFRYKRSDSLCRITWECEDANYAGFGVAGDFYASLETDIFIGLLNDESLSMDLDSQEVSFTVIGRESLLARAAVPFASLAVGQNISAIIYSCLNQSPITNLLTVSALNIVVGTDAAVDSIVDLQNKTVQDALNDLLLISNSVLFIQNDAIFVAPRTASAAVKYHFFGQASKAGRENIQNITAIKSGLSRVFNYLSWNPSNALVNDASSVSKFGVRQKEFKFSYLTDTTKQTALLNAILNEFSLPKQEMEISTPFFYDTLAINLLDRVDIDYPTVMVPGDFPIPVCGIAVCGSAVLPRALWSFTVSTGSNYKVIGKSLNLKDCLYTLKLRLI